MEIDLTLSFPSENSSTCYLYIISRRKLCYLKSDLNFMICVMVLLIRYGKVFKSYVLGRYTVFMTGREASKILLTGKDGIVSLNLFYTGQQVLGPTSLLQQTGEAHKRLRRLIAEPLSVDGLKKYFQFINSLAIETLDQWSGRKILVLEETSTVESCDHFFLEFSLTEAFLNLSHDVFCSLH